MIPEFIAELPKFRLSLVLETKLERLLGNVMVKPLNPGIGP